MARQHRVPRAVRVLVLDGAGFQRPHVRQWGVRLVHEAVDRAKMDAFWYVVRPAFGRTTSRAAHGVVGFWYIPVTSAFNKTTGHGVVGSWYAVTPAFGRTTSHTVTGLWYVVRAAFGSTTSHAVVGFTMDVNSSKLRVVLA